MECQAARFCFPPPFLSLPSPSFPSLATGGPSLNENENEIKAVDGGRPNAETAWAVAPATGRRVLKNESHRRRSLF